MIAIARIVVPVCLFIVLGPLSQALAHDTDIYTVSNSIVQPNVLIMFDNSGSMNDPATGELYDPGVTYPLVYAANPGMVYYNVRGQTWNTYRNSVNDIVCSTVKTALQTEGFYTGPIVFGTSDCSGRGTTNLRTGNYMNYLQISGGSETHPKLGLAKGIIQSYVNTTEGVRFGAMIFNSPVNDDSQGGHLLAEVRDMTAQNRSSLHSAIGALHADTWTPLAETLYEAGLYFQGKASQFNRDSNNGPIQYTSPIQYYCQKNYVIIITDGEPTKDDDPVLGREIGDQDGDGREPGYSLYQDNGTDYLDDVARYYHHKIDLRPDLEETQDLTVYTIGFGVNSPLLERTAQAGGGKYFYCHNAQSFIIAMQQIMNEILARSSSFVAPVVPISQMESTSAENRLYLAMFKTASSSFWKGNLKKFQIASAASGSTVVGDILDASGNKAMDSNHKIKETSISYWSSVPDGGEVELGGVGEVLQDRTAPRKIYTYMGSEKELTNSVNAFALSNTLILPQTVGLNQNDAAGRDKVIQFIHGYDSYDENGNGITSEKRDWILGAFIHSRPLIIHYGSNPTDPSVIFVGGNDGMLHAFDDDSGQELWAFIPPNLLPKLKNLSGGTLEYFVDGAPKAYIEKDSSGVLKKAILVVGQRRGGDRYVALDVTTRGAPKFLWEIGPSTPGFEELGQTWSTPHIGMLEDGTPAAFFGGGYDENQDQEVGLSTDRMGRGIYVVNVLSGSLIWSYTNAKNSAMKYCIPSDITRVDTNGSGKIDRLYVGDIGGRIWRFDIVSASTASWSAKNIFNANPGSSDSRKIFYPPDVTLENIKSTNQDYEMLFFGTGDREHPRDTAVVNRIYSVKDLNPATVLTENDLVDVTSDEYQTTTDQARKNAILNELESKSGWYIRLDQNSGEKVLSPPVVFAKTAYFTTFTPTFPAGNDPCAVEEGRARTYMLQYKNGNAAFNLDGSNDLGTQPVLARTDRSEFVGAGIPSGVIITFLGGKSVAYSGVGGGVYSPRLGSVKSLIPIYWRIVN